jgi:hypothetical protein
MGEACSTHQRDVKYITNFVSKCDRMRKIGRPQCRWKNNTETDLE